MSRGPEAELPRDAKGKLSLAIDGFSVCTGPLWALIPTPRTHTPQLAAAEQNKVRRVAVTVERM